MELEIDKKYSGVHQKFIQEQKFLEDLGEHLRPGVKKKPFLLSSYFNLSLNHATHCFKSY